MNTARLLTIALLFTFLTLTLAAQTTEFTYQGNLVNNGAPATGNYDFEFLLYDALSGGTQLGSTLAINGVAVAGGVFSVKLDFGDQFPGADRFLAISVRAAGGGSFTVISPRQKVNSTPYAVRSLTASSVESVPVSALPPGSANYIQNQSAASQTADFSISGNGSIGGNLGIGTTNPQSKLNVSSFGYGLTHSFGEVTVGSYVDGNGGWLGTRSNHPLNFFTNDSAPLMTIATSGNVGIATNNPLHKLHVEGGSGNAVYGNSSANIGIYGTTASGIGVYGSSSSLGVGVKGYSSSGFAGYFDGKVLVYPSSGNGLLAFRNRTNTNFSQLLFNDDTDTYRGYIGYLGSNAGLGFRNDTVEFGSNAKAITFRPSETEVMRLTTTGRVGIGTQLPTSKLFVVGGALAAVYGTSDNSTAVTGVSTNGNGVFGSSSSGYGVYGSSTTGYAGYFDGRVFLNRSDDLVFGTIETSASTENFLCYGNAYPHRVGNCNSSLRYKTDVRTFSGGLSIINRLRSIAFNWKQDGTSSIGLAAEEVEKVEPLLTFHNDKGEVEGVRYTRLSAVFINAFKEQQTEISELRAVSGEQAKNLEDQRSKIKDQQLQIETQQTQIDALTALVCASNKTAEICKEELK